MLPLGAGVRVPLDVLHFLGTGRYLQLALNRTWRRLYMQLFPACETAVTAVVATVSLLAWVRGSGYEWGHSTTYKIAEGGHLHCQYALATIHLMKLTCISEEEERQHHEREIVQATRWLIAAARQGCWPAVDNLVTSGVGPEAERARESLRAREQPLLQHDEWQAALP